MSPTRRSPNSRGGATLSGYNPHSHLLVFQEDNHDNVEDRSTGTATSDPARAAGQGPRGQAEDGTSAQPPKQGHTREGQALEATAPCRQSQRSKEGPPKMRANPDLMIVIGYCGLILFSGWTASYIAETFEEILRR